MKELLERALVLGGVVDQVGVNTITEYIDSFAEKGYGISVKSLEEVVKYYKAEERRLRTEDLLEWMNENDQQAFETEDCKVTIRTSVSSKVIDPDSAFAWLIKNQYGDLIKDTLDFPKGELTEEVEDILKEIGLSYTKKSGIHPQTLKKVISDRLKDGEDLPDEDAGIKVGYFDECVVKAKG